jgi:hypothetical protein
MDQIRRQKAARLRELLAQYRGGRFEVAESGGAGGMMFWRDADGRAFYMGGFQPAAALGLAEALNVTLDLLESGSPQ